MKTHPQEIMIYYNANSSYGKQTVAYAHSLSRHIKELEFDKASLTPVQWKSLLASMNIEPKNLLNKSDDYYQSNIKGKEFDEEGWLNVLSHNPNLINGSIVVMGKKVVFCKSPTEIFRILQPTQQV
ncbi:MAG: glutaredoxin [Chitinophagaceae bacterium]|nr:MAG: glutaredoxin [Chitinophagaceae bacterium]